MVFGKLASSSGDLLYSELILKIRKGAVIFVSTYTPKCKIARIERAF